ncbi:MAG: hypothetical protein PUB37_06810 [Firmicutes bacterium]|nr:hypothetical protein [Bacillota bacterium]
MNGELMNMIQMTLTVKHYIRTGEVKELLASNSIIGSMHFTFAEQDFGEKAPSAEIDTKDEWLKELVERGAEDVKLLVVDELDSFDRLALVNGMPCCMLCFYTGGVTSWNKRWSFDEDTQKWNVHFVETVCHNAPPEKPKFYDITPQFVTLLEKIRGLAQKLGLGEFAFKFSAALGSLQADFVHGDASMTPAHHRLLSAAIQAYVFGEKGSWNDKAKFAAAGKGLSEEYESLTKDLYRGIALACMYAVNEW